MPKLDKSVRREELRAKARRGMKTESRSVFTIQRVLGERAVEAKPERKGRVRRGKENPRSPK